MIFNDAFAPKLGKIRDRTGGASKRLISQVLAEAGRGGKAGTPDWRVENHELRSEDAGRARSFTPVRWPKARGGSW